MKKKPIPTTVLSGFLGAGKTSVLTHILKNTQDKKYALIVNDMAALNIDASLIKRDSSLVQTKENLVEMSNGCICCTLREDLLVEVKKLCESGDFDGLIIEGTGIAEPMPIAQTFVYKDEESGIDLTKYAYIDTMVTVVDATTFLDYIDNEETIVDKKWTDDEADARGISQLLIDQIECANIIIVNKISDTDEKTKKAITDHILALAPSVKIFYTDYGHIDPSAILHTGLFDLETMEQSPAWVQELMRGHHNHTPETEEYGISNFVYTRQRPFHPQRLYEVLTSPLDNVIRAKGFCRLMSRPDGALEWSLAGKQGTLKYGGRRVAAMTQEEQAMMDPETKAYYDSIMDPVHGDRLTQFVVIGVGIDPHALTKKFDAALVTDEEWKQDWMSFEDPFEQFMSIATTSQ